MKKTRAKGKSGNEWQKTFDAIADLIFIQDTDFNIIRANKAFAKALNMKPEDIIGKKCYEILHKKNEPWDTCPFEKTRKDKKPHSEQVDDPNISIPLLVTTTPIFDEKEKLVGSVHIAKDISKIKKTEKRLKKANKDIKILYKELERTNKELQKIDQLKSEFVSTVSHELRTPLSIMKEGISLVLDEVPGKINEKQKKVLDMSKDNIDRLARVINDLLDISKIEAGKMELRKVLVDFPALMKDIYARWKLQSDRRHQDLQIFLPDSPVNIYADPDRVNQVLNNLLSNATKYTPEGGKIKIELQDRKDRVDVSVSDTGIGIAKENLPKVFSKFQQFGRRAGGGAKGTGLGLSISKQLVEMHKGTIIVESEPNKGTRFSFSLPKTDKS